MQGKHLGHQILEIDDLDAVFAQDRGKGVMLALGDLQKGDVVEEQLAQTLGRELQQLLPRAVEQHLFKRRYLAFDLDSVHIPPPYMLSGADTPMSASAFLSVIIVAVTRPRR